MREAILLPKQIEEFYESGLLLIRNLFDKQDIFNMTKYVNQMKSLTSSIECPLVYCETSRLDAEKQIIIRVEKFLESYPILNSIFSKAKFLEPIEQLLNDKPCLFKDKVIFKLSGGSGFQPHQDYNFGWENFASYYINAMITIDETNQDNGCVEFALGGHKKGLLGEKWHLLSEEDVLDLQFTPFCTQPGDIILFDSLLPHKSKQNLTNKDRKVIYLTYNGAREGDFREKYFNYIPKIRRKFFINKIQNIIKNNNEVNKIIKDLPYV